MQDISRRVLSDIRYRRILSGMAKPESYPAVTLYSKAFGAALAEVMKKRSVSQVLLGQEIDRPQSYISDRLRGMRACDTDMIAGVAALSGITTRQVVLDVLKEMRLAAASVPVDQTAIGPRRQGRKSTGPD